MGAAAEDTSLRQLRDKSKIVEEPMGKGFYEKDRLMLGINNAARDNEKTMASP